MDGLAQTWHRARAVQGYIYSKDTISDWDISETEKRRLEMTRKRQYDQKELKSSQLQTLDNKGGSLDLWL